MTGVISLKNEAVEEGGTPSPGGSLNHTRGAFKGCQAEGVLCAAGVDEFSPMFLKNALSQAHVYGIGRRFIHEHHREQKTRRYPPG